MHLQRPELAGTFGMVATTHWLASAAGMRMLELGGTAADAAAAAGITLGVVEPHLCGPLGDMPALVWPAGDDVPHVICGQGPAPAGATRDHYVAEGLDLIPGAGLLATVIPGAWDAWMLMLLRGGSLPLRTVMEPAIAAAHGHPLLPRAAAGIAEMADLFRAEWPSSAATWLPGGAVPAPGEVFANPALAAFWERLLAEAEAAEGRAVQIERARTVHAEGFVAEAVQAQIDAGPVMDGTGARRAGALSAGDMAGWRATVEPALAVDHHGWTVWKCGPWTQGPVLLQTLLMLEGDDLSAPDSTHLAVEALKRAFADREAYYGDPDHSDIPTGTLLSRDFAAARRATIGDAAAGEVAPGPIPGREAWAAAATRRARMTPGAAGLGGGEPTMAHLANARGDTVHVDVVDRWGNMVSATPSGGWLKSNPVVPGLGVPLNSRAQMFWLEEGRPTTLAPGRRPRTTLSPSMAQAPDGTRMAFGTPGGDQQDQWQAAFLLGMIHRGQGMQAAIEAPLFHTAQLTASFHPRGLRLRHLMIEPHAGEAAIADLRARGHEVEVAEPWSVGRLTAVSRRPDGVMRAAATPRLGQAYAAGR
ncbi:gamma-glutamyltransferase [Jannaschia sp. Os4]|nr:gamma-glutamyltransferase [Jannaschia sp. Os4]MBM2577731.1 gamma-glutamyltransferase [Jannaschia sp. Os4]